VNDPYLIASNYEPLDHESFTTTHDWKDTGGYGEHKIYYECKALCSSEAISREKGEEYVPSKNECSIELKRRTDLEEKPSAEVEEMSDQCSR
jgi:hypothetical protein